MSIFVLPTTEDVIKLFKRKDVLNGTYIAYKLKIPDKNTNNFSEHYTMKVRLLEVNPGYDVASSDMIQNKYGLKEPYKRNSKIDIIIDE